MGLAPTPWSWSAVALLINAALVAAHFVVFAATRSHLVLAQGADSLMDVAVTAILAFSARVGARPDDANHPFGHGRAEPIGALVSAVLACVLTVEVARSTLEAAFAGTRAVMDASVLGVLAAKLAVKLVMVIVLAGRARALQSPALDAVVIDSRNDLAATGASLLGFFAVRAGFPLADTVFALLVCGYVAHNGVGLFRENLRYLMGEAPDAETMQKLRAAAGAVEGVCEVGTVVAHHVGNRLHVEVAVVVPADLSAAEGHDLAERVQRAVEAEDVVARAFVHVDTR